MRLHSLLVATLFTLFSSSALAEFRCFDHLRYEAGQLIGLRTGGVAIPGEPYESDYLFGLNADVQRQLLTADPERGICIEATMLDEYNVKKEAREKSPVYHVEVGEHSTSYERAFVDRVYAVKTVMPYTPPTE